MIHKKGDNWAKLDLKWKNGTFFFSDATHRSDVVFTKENWMLKNYLYNVEE